MSKAIINCKKGTRKLYQQIADTKYFEGDKDLSISLIFCIAIAYGYMNNSYEEFDGSEWLTRVEYVERNFEMKRFIEAIAVSHEGQLEVLSDDERVYKIAEAYANGGLNILFSDISDNVNLPDFDKKLETIINDISKEHKISDE